MGMVFTEILAKIDRAAVNGQKLHLDIEHVRALATSPVYASIAEMKAKEFADLWEKEPEQEATSRRASNSGSSGLNPAPSEASGSLPGTMLTLVHVAAEKQASATAERIAHLSKRKRR
ncbi:hypothetical protein [Sphingobium sp.]|uniref:hypothetical protein n=1 Tax=Sphingobium sp. TaxID=1912891 RepID=UPI0035C6D882